jgi:NTP pyrophosphatase (non-canonical NTP hydrolase)
VTSPPVPIQGRIVVLLTSPRVAPGLLSWSGWQALRSADLVGAAAVTPASRAAEVDVEIVGGDDRARWAWLRETASSGANVVWFAGDDGDPGLLRMISDELVTEPGQPFEVEILTASYDVPGARLVDLVRVMDRLRSECPWDKEQTHRTLATYLLEEAYETLEAIETGDRAHLREELGDLLLQVMFHSRIAEEDLEDPWSVDDVAGDIVDKLIRRHPHVFADVDAADAAAVEANWDTIKAAEKQRTSVLEGIPQSLPALALADKVLARAANQHRSLATSGPASRASLDASGQLGAELLDLVRRSRSQGIDAEQALRDAVRDLADQIRAAES